MKSCCIIIPVRNGPNVAVMISRGGGAGTVAIVNEEQLVGRMKGQGSARNKKYEKRS